MGNKHKQIVELHFVDPNEKIGIFEKQKVIIVKFETETKVVKDIIKEAEDIVKNKYPSWRGSFTGGYLGRDELVDVEVIES